MESAAAGSIELEATREETDELYRRHGRAVALVCRRLLRDPGEAEDATQQVFLSAHRALLRGTAPRDPAAWLATIARNECRARIRERMSTPLALPAGVLDGAGGDPSAAAGRRAELAAFWQALGDLPRAQRDAVVLRELRGLSYDQVAEQLALSHAAVRSLLGRARQRLRLRLRDVHSGVGGVPWLEALARFLVGGGSSAAPLAAKAAALGLGAAAITGGAAVAPEALRHHVRPIHAPRTEQPAQHRQRPAPAARPVSSVVASQPVEDRRGSGERGLGGRSNTDGGHRSRDRGSPRDERARDAARQTTDGGSTGRDRSGGDVSLESGSAGDGGGSGEPASSGEGGGTGESGSSGDGSSGDGSSGE